MKNILLTITGPSLTGKTELMNRFKQHGFEELVSVTTRQKRMGEVEGEIYNFISVEQFKALVDNNKMLQHNPVDDNYYGLPLSSYETISKKNKNAVIVVAPSGAKQIANYCLNHNINLYQIFINNAQELLLERFLNRFKNDSLANTQNYTKRLINMITKEQNEWVKPALNSEDYYDIVFNDFGPNNEKYVINTVLTNISKKFNKQNKPRN